MPLDWRLSQTGSDKDNDNGQEARVVGARLCGGSIEKFMFWVGCPRDQCTYEAGLQNSIEPVDVLRQAIELFDCRGNQKFAIPRVHLGGSRYTLQLCGRSSIHTEIGRMIDLDLLNWRIANPRSDIISWRVSTYHEYDQPKPRT